MKPARVRQRRHIISGLVLLPILLITGWLVTRGSWADPGGSSSATAQLVGPTMGGGWSVRFARPLSGETAGRVRAEIQATLDRLERQMSTWSAASDLSRFNAGLSTDWVPVPIELADVVVEAQRVSSQTGGAFDATVAPLVNLWGFGPASRTPRTAAERIPAEDAIADAKSRVGHARLQARTDPPALRKLDPALTVDLSAIAQGYAADRVSEALRGSGFGDHLVDVCGEIRAAGAGPHGGAWRVAVQAPVPDTIHPFRTVRLSNLALATSGDYQNFFDHAGRRYSHEIDPRTGRPTDHSLASVTTAHPSAATADALATALMVLGPADGWSLAQRENLPALFITRSARGFESRATPAFEQLLVSGMDDARPHRAAQTTGPIDRGAE